jgi:hypothetical protein
MIQLNSPSWVIKTLIIPVQFLSKFKFLAGGLELPVSFIQHGKENTGDLLWFGSNCCRFRKCYALEPNVRTFGSIVEYLPHLREIRVRFPVPSATFGVCEVFLPRSLARRVERLPYVWW